MSLALVTDDSLFLLIFCCAQGVENTGLGARIADTCIWGLGRSSLGLAYALNFADLVLAMGMPSTTARAAGVFVPLITSLSKSFGSYPSKSVQVGEIGSVQDARALSSAAGLHDFTAQHDILCQFVVGPLCFTKAHISSC